MSILSTTSPHFPLQASAIISRAKNRSMKSTKSEGNRLSSALTDFQSIEMLFESAINWILFFALTSTATSANILTKKRQNYASNADPVAQANQVIPQYTNPAPLNSTASSKYVFVSGRLAKSHRLRIFVLQVIVKNIVSMMTTISDFTIILFHPFHHLEISTPYSS